MVTLSACETQWPEQVPEDDDLQLVACDEWSGLCRAFFFAGPSTVVSTLWRIPDDAAPHLMQVFCSSLMRSEAGRAEALRRGALAVRAHPEWQSPYYWARFVLSGDWRARSP
jgi:CHAT domain-containing protein